MGVAAFRSGFVRAALTVVTALAIACSLLAPQGFMTQRGADGGLQIVLCTGYGPATSLAMPGMDMGDEKPAHPGKGSDMACPFASHVGLSGPADPGPALAELPPVYAPPPAPVPLTAAPGRGMPAPPPPSRAPPRLVA